MEVVGGGGGSTLAVERAAVNCFREVNKVSSPRQSAGQWDDIRGHRLRTPKPNSYSGYSSRIPPICRFLLDGSPLPFPLKIFNFSRGQPFHISRSTIAPFFSNISEASPLRDSYAIHRGILVSADTSPLH